MKHASKSNSSRTEWLGRSLSRWENEGGASSTITPPQDSGDEPLTTTELLHLRSRVIALENLLLSLLVTASREQLDLAREMAAYISPRPGFAHHPMTEHAAVQMGILVERAERFRG
ncbi:MAG: hypothetical protein J0I65_24905 [Variovorax sp.]|nr:hypothetical protein [Variovorax sp.]|tara:strand:- start:403 stop:750 length:348 start_codon:yes stop_codon:yes gene_type:complete